MLFEQFVPESGGFLKHMLLVLKYRIPATTTSRVAINRRQFVSDSYQEPGVPTMTSPYIIAPVSILSPTVTPLDKMYGLKGKTPMQYAASRL